MLEKLRNRVRGDVRWPGLQHIEECRIADAWNAAQSLAQLMEWRAMQPSARTLLMREHLFTTELCFAGTVKYSTAAKKRDVVLAASLCFKPFFNSLK